MTTDPEICDPPRLQFAVSIQAPLAVDQCSTDDHSHFFQGRIVYDRSRPDGTPRKLLDSGRIQALGWSATTPLEEGLRLYYDWFLSNQGKLRETVIEATTSE